MATRGQMEERAAEMKATAQKRKSYEMNFELTYTNKFNFVLKKSGIEGCLWFIFKLVMRLMLANDRTYLPPIDNTPI